MLHPRWNFSSRARELSDADVIVLSIPKSGRTWVRTFLNAYYAAHIGHEFSLAVTDHRAEGIPRIIYSHDRFEHRTKGNNWDRIRGKYLVPQREMMRARIVLLARDPRDTFVSYFVQLTRRNPATPNELRQMSADALLRHRRFGIAAMVEVMNRWLEEFADRNDFIIVRYEDFRADPSRNFRDLLKAMGEKQIDEAALNRAIDFSDFRNMQKLEAAGEFGSKILRPRDREDPDSFKVRQGKIGSFREYLSEEGSNYAAQACSTLNPRFGYGIQRRGK